MSTMLYGIEICGTSEKDVNLLESAHKDIARVVQDLSLGIAPAGVLIP